MKWSFERAWELPPICCSWVRVPIAIWWITPKNCPSTIRIRRKDWEHEKKDVWKGAEGISFGAFLYWIACQRGSYTRTRQYTFMPFGLYRFNPKELSNMIKNRKFVSHLDREYKPFLIFWQYQNEDHKKSFILVLRCSWARYFLTKNWMLNKSQPNKYVVAKDESLGRRTKNLMICISRKGSHNHLTGGVPHIPNSSVAEKGGFLGRSAFPLQPSASILSWDHGPREHIREERKGLDWAAHPATC